MWPSLASTPSADAVAHAQQSAQPPLALSAMVCRFCVAAALPDCVPPRSASLSSHDDQKHTVSDWLRLKRQNIFLEIIDRAPLQYPMAFNFYEMPVFAALQSSFCAGHELTLLPQRQGRKVSLVAPDDHSHGPGSKRATISTKDERTRGARALQHERRTRQTGSAPV